MTKERSATFQDALERVESLPPDQQENLIDVVRRRLVEGRREEIAANIEAARDEFRRGEVERGSVDEFLDLVSG